MGTVGSIFFSDRDEAVNNSSLRVAPGIGIVTGFMAPGIDDNMKCFYLW